MTTTPLVWRAAVGPGGTNGSAVLSSYGAGAGSLVLALRGLRAASPYTVRIVAGTCAREGTAMFSSGRLMSSAAGEVSANVVVPEAKLSVIKAVPGPVTVRAGTGPALRCGVLAGGPSRSFDVTPGCLTDSLTEASSQARARLGAYYFDGWTQISGFHFDGLVDGPFADREPVTGWIDSTPCAVEQQLATARSFGLDYFVFDWYFDVPARSGGENLNSALQLTASLRDRHGMQYAIHYVNHEPFGIAPTDWSRAVEEWVSYFRDPAYFRVNGSPFFVVLDPNRMRTAFGSSAAVRDAFEDLRAAAEAAGMPGVTIVGNVGVPVVGDTSGFAGQFQNALEADGYDALSTFHYAYSPTPPSPDEQPFASLAAAARWQWDQAAAASPLPFIAMAMPGWDPRPWREVDPVAGYVRHYTRSTTEVANLIGEAIEWADANPRLQLEPSLTPPLVLIQSWNELGEGAYLVPTIGDGRSYGEALGSVLTEPQSRDRSILTLSDSGPTASPRRAHGRLTTSDGPGIAGARIKVAGLALDGDGFYGDYHISGIVPPRATRAIVGFYVGQDINGTATSGSCDLAVYGASFRHPGGAERVANPDFSAGASGWWLGSRARLVASNRGPGMMVQATTEGSQRAVLSSAAFAVAAPGTEFAVSIAARVAPRCRGDGYLTVIFLDDVAEVRRTSIALASTALVIGTDVTGADGSYRIDLSELGTAHVRLEASFVGDASHHPAWVSTTE